MKIGNQIRKRRIELGLSQDELAKKTGYKSRSSITRIESGEGDNLTQSKILQFAKALKTTPSYILGEEDNEELPPNIMVPAAYPVPILGTICAGDGIICEQNYSGQFFIDKSIKADYCLRVKGDSMIDAGIHDGDIAFLKQNTNFEDGKIYAVVYGIAEEATLKRVMKVDGHVVLQPCNKDYKPIVIAADEMQIVGQLAGFYHKTM